jgi:hypothetical protein
MDITQLETLLNTSALSQSTKDQTIKTIKACLRICGTSNVYDIYNNMELVKATYEGSSDSYKKKTFAHINRCLELMSEDQKKNIKQSISNKDSDSDLEHDDSSSENIYIPPSNNQQLVRQAEAIRQLQEDNAQLKTHVKELKDLMLMCFQAPSYEEGLKRVSMYALSQMACFN